MSDQLTLFSQPRARATDPATSHEAAASIEAWVQDDALLAKFAKYGPLTDDELASVCPTWYGPTVKTARSRLKNRGLLVDSGEKRKSQRGHNMTVWKLATP